MLKPVLVLNASYEALGISSAKRAMKLLVKDVAVIEESHDIVVHGTWMLPSVVRLKNFVKVPIKIHEPSRKNILTRDRNTCQYCHKVFAANKLTLDHILPKSRGGKNVFENLVASCQPCNLFKADRLPSEAGMKLLNTPRPITIHVTRDILRHKGAEDPKWRRYLWYSNDNEINHWNGDN